MFLELSQTLFPAGGQVLELLSLCGLVYIHTLARLSAVDTGCPDTNKHVWK